MKKTIVKYRNFLAPLIVIILSLPTIFPLLKPDFYSTFDGDTLVARFARFDQAFHQGQLLPRWVDGLAFNLGSPVLMYYGLLVNYLAEIPRSLGVSLSGSIEVVLGLSLVISGLTFYYWIKNSFGYLAGVVGGLFYVWAPYRLLDVYVRGEAAESLALIFPPILFLSLEKIINNKSLKWMVIGSLSLTGMMLSHNLVTLLFLVIYILYGLLIIILNRAYQQIKNVLLSISLGLGLSAFYWIPAYFEKSYINADLLNFSSPYLTNFVTLRQIIYSPWGWGPLNSDSPFSPQLGLAGILAVSLVVLSSILFFSQRYINNQRFQKALKVIFQKITKENWLKVGFFGFCIIVAIFLMIKSSIFLWNNISLLSFFLYPWRFLILAIFGLAFMSSFLVYLSRSSVILSVMLVILVVFANRNHLQLVGIEKSDDNYFSNYVQTSDMWGEYLPRQANLAMVVKCKANNCFFPKIEVPSGVKLITEEERHGLVTFSYQSQNEFQTVINTYYFPGWKIFLDNVSEIPISVTEMGVISFQAPSGNHSLKVMFTNTTLRTFSGMISIISVGILVCILFLKKYLSWKR